MRLRGAGRRVRFVVLCLILVFLAGCGSPKGSPEAAPSSPSAAAGDHNGTQNSSDGPPPASDDHPFSTRGLVFGPRGVIFNASIVGYPEGGGDVSPILLPDGRVEVYLGVGTHMNYSAAYSADGVNFSAPFPVPLPAWNHDRVVPIEGGYRVYGRTGEGIGSALSGNGRNFTIETGYRVEQSMFRESSLTGPTLLTLPGGGWRMYLSDNGPPPNHVLSAISSDGLHWTVEPGVRIGSGTNTTTDAVHPFAIRDDAGRVLLFFSGDCGRLGTSGDDLIGICYMESTDGLNFTALHPAVTIRLGDFHLDPGAIPGDPAVIRVGSSWVLYYNTYVPATGETIVQVAVAQV